MRSSVLPVARMRLDGVGVLLVLACGSEVGEIARLRTHEPWAWKRKVSVNVMGVFASERGSAKVA